MMPTNPDPDRPDRPDRSERARRERDRDTSFASMIFFLVLMAMLAWSMIDRDRLDNRVRKMREQVIQTCAFAYEGTRPEIPRDAAIVGRICDPYWDGRK